MTKGTTMKRIERLMAYAAQRYGDSPATTGRVLEAVRNGTEHALLTPKQRRRDRHARGSGRLAAWTDEAARTV